MTYPTDYGRCIVCGSDRGQLCDTASAPSVPRDEPHHSRSLIGANEPQVGFVAVRDEPEWTADR